MDFSSQIKQWYAQNKRDLPWRRTSDPYKIWLSEIILQQTRVDQGMAYYLKFTEHFPTVFDLANASEDNVLKLWQGLGYYSRARNLHFTAKYIVAELDGKFPSNHKGILTLKGVGSYTAAAIASFCFNIPAPVIDGNVYRVLSRYFGIEEPIDTTTGKKIFEALAEELIDRKDPATHNQAIMEFGALQCTPKSPNCTSCPLADSCMALEKGLIETLPIKSKKLKQRDRFFNYIVLNEGNYIYINKRTGKGIWQNLYDFPLIESSQRLTEAEIPEHPDFRTLTDNNSIEILAISSEYKHILSHQKIHAIFWEIKLSAKAKNLRQYERIIKNKINDFALPKLIENYIGKHQEYQ
jgi:A/G-specific adenine glycosylase